MVQKRSLFLFLLLFLAFSIAFPVSLFAAQPEARFLLGKTDVYNAGTAAAEVSDWYVWDFAVDDPDALLSSVTVSGFPYGDDYPLHFYSGEKAFWEPMRWPSLGATADDLRSNAGGNTLRFTVKFTPKSGAAWTQLLEYDLTNLKDDEIKAAFGGLSVKRSNTELRTVTRNYSQRLLQVLSPRRNDNKFVLQWNGTSPWKPDSSRGRLFLSQYFHPGIRARFMKYWDFNGASATVDMDVLRNMQDEPVDWRDYFIKDGFVDIFYKHEDPLLSYVRVVSRIQVLPDIRLEPEGTISKVFKRSDSETFVTLPEVSKTARILAVPHFITDPSWETSEISFLLDGAPMKHRNQEEVYDRNNLSRYGLAGWTEDPNLSGNHEIAVELTYRNGQKRRVAKTINLTTDASRFPEADFFGREDFTGPFVNPKPDVSAVFSGLFEFDPVLLPGEIATVSTGVFDISDGLSKSGTVIWKSGINNPKTEIPLYVVGYPESSATKLGIGDSWKTAYPLLRYHYIDAVAYDVRYELHSTNASQAQLSPNFSLSYNRFVPAKGEVTYKIGIFDLHFDRISERMIKSVTISGPGFTDGVNNSFNYWDGGRSLEVFDTPFWNEADFWNSIPSNNRLTYEFTVTKQDGTVLKLPFEVDVTDLRNNMNGFKTAFQDVSVVRQGKELSLGETPRTGEYLHVLSPDNTKNLFTVSDTVAMVPNVNPFDSVRFSLRTSVNFNSQISQRLDRNDKVAIPGDQVTVNPASLYTRGRRDMNPQDWREWFLKTGELRTNQKTAVLLPVNGGAGNPVTVNLMNAVEILPDVMLSASVNYRKIHEPAETETSFKSPREELQFYLYGTVLPLADGGTAPILSGTVAGKTFEESSPYSSGFGSLSKEETNFSMNAFFKASPFPDGTQEAVVKVTYPDKSTRTMKRGFELHRDEGRYPLNSTLEVNKGSGYVTVENPAVWTGKETFRWKWNDPKNEDLASTDVQVSGIKDKQSKGYGYTSFKGAGPLVAEMTNLPADLDFLHPMLTHIYAGGIGYQESYRLRPVPATLKVTLTNAPDGAAWSVDGGASWNASGALLSLYPMAYTVTFKEFDGWDTPASIVVTLAKGGAEAISKAYVPWTGTISALLTPADGSTWSINGGAAKASGTSETLQSGPGKIYNLSFNNPSGYYRAEDRKVLLSSKDQVENISVYFRKIPAVKDDEKITDDPDDNSGVVELEPGEVTDIQNGSGELDLGDTKPEELEPYVPEKGEVTPQPVDENGAKTSLDPVLNKDGEGKNAEAVVLSTKSFEIDASGETKGKFVPVHVEFTITEEDLNGVDPGILDRIKVSRKETSLTEAFLHEVHLFKIIALESGSKPVDLVAKVNANSEYKKKLDRFFVVEEEGTNFHVAFDLLVMDGLPKDTENLVQPLMSGPEEKGNFLVFDGKEDGKYTDPLALAVPKSKAAPDGSSGGGCSAGGFAPALVLLLLPLVFMRNKQ